MVLATGPFIGLIALLNNTSFIGGAVGRFMQTPKKMTREVDPVL